MMSNSDIICIYTIHLGSHLRYMDIFHQQCKSKKRKEHLSNSLNDMVIIHVPTRYSKRMEY